MKGINVRKIAALTSALILGASALAVADVYYGNTQLVDQNGQPTVKVYVGSKAAVSDGIAAANIAAKIANEAYKSSTLTASVSGTPTCSVGTGIGGTGTCSIVESSKKVTLEVTVPGTIAGVHEFKTLISDTIDRTPANRISTSGDDIYNNSAAAPDTTGTPPSPLRGSEKTTDSVEQLLYRIGSSQFTGFSDYSVVDNQAVSTTYTEQQDFYVGSQAGAVKYYSSDKNIAVSKYHGMAYSAKFMGNDFGIPVCTGDLNSSQSDDWTSCASDSNSRTARHRVKIKFMGAEWIISEMTEPTTTSSGSTTAVVAGGQIKLAKESKYGIVNVGQVLDAGTFKIRLSDISVAVGTENKHPAIIDILDANEQVVGQIQVDPGTTYTFTQSGTSNSVKIHVYKTAPGFTLNAKWAEMAIYSDEITLKDNSRYNLVSSTDTDQNFWVSLMWKNKDFPGGSGLTAANNRSDSLRQIVVYQYDSFDKAAAGSVYNFLKSAPTFKLTYNGLDLTDDDYVSLSLESMSPESQTVAVSGGATGESDACTTGTTVTYANPRWVKISTAGQSLLGGTSNIIAGNYMVDYVYFDPIGLTINASNSSQALNSTNGTAIGTNMTTYYNDPGQWGPKVFWKVSGRNCFNWDTVTFGNSSSEYVRFDTAGDNSQAQGAIYFQKNTTDAGMMGASNATFQAAIILQEDAGKVNTTSNNLVYTALPLIITDTTTVGSGGFRFQTSSSSTSKVYYRGLSVGDFATASGQDVTFITERGTKATGVASTTASLKVAKKVGMPTFQFAFADTSIATGAEAYDMKVGESKVFGGVTVKVKAIDATAGSCSVLGPGGTPACTVDTGSLNAVIQPNNAASVVVTEPFALQSNLVYKDTDGAAAGVAVLVGGPEVNTLTKEALAGSAVDFNVDTVVVKEIGNSKIVVAGKTADDTTTAADQFIAGVQRQ